MYTTFTTCSTNNLLSFFGLIDARITKNRQEITCISAIANIKTCKLCNQGFLDDNSLANHVTDLHTVLNTCDECNNEFPTGKSFSETLILASTNPQYDKILFIDLPAQHMKTTISEHALNVKTKTI